MFRESLLSMPMQEKAEVEAKPSYGSALVWILFAWIIALIRGILGASAHEGWTLDVVLSVLVLTAMPLTALYVWWNEHERPKRFAGTSSPRRRRSPLVLVSN